MPKIIIANPFITIITVNYNNQEGLFRTLLSISVQTYSNYEVIIIDANSSDSSLELVKQFQKDIINIRCISEPDKGISDGMNKGIKYSLGTYLLFLNSGDTLYESVTLEKLEREILDKNQQNISSELPDIMIYRQLIKYVKFNYITEWSQQKNFFNSIGQSNFIPHQSTLIKKRLFETFGTYDLNFKIAFDYEFWIRIVREKIQVSYSNTICSVYISGGKSSNIILSSIEELKIKMRYISLYENQPIKLLLAIYPLKILYRIIKVYLLN